MATYTRQLIAALGPAYAGQAASVTYTVKDTAGSVLIAATNSGVTESTVSPGTYLAAATFTDTWAGRIDWQLGGIGAVEDFGPHAVLLTPHGLDGVQLTDPVSNADLWSSLPKALAAMLHALNMGGRKRNTGSPAAGTEVIQNKAGAAISTAPWTNADGVFDQEPAS
jgi:hypothetical protein